MFLSRQNLSRRTALKGIGASIALPFLDAMLPAGAMAQGRKPLRLIAMEMVHGAAGSTAYGIKKNMWSPAATGSSFDLGPTSLKALEPYRDYLTIVSNTDVRNAEAFAASEIGADHFRSAAVFLTQSKPKQTQGSDVFAGTSFDQIYAQKFGDVTPIPSMQLCIENVDQAGGCSYNYSCVYTDTISWSSPTEPLPMIRDPRAVFDQLFGVGATPEARRAGGRTTRAFSTGSPNRLVSCGASWARRIARDWRTTSMMSARSSGASRKWSSRTRPASRANSRRADRRARFVRRARQADVRSPGGGAGGGHDPHLFVQVQPRRLEPRLRVERIERGVPYRLAPSRSRRSHHRFPEDQHLSRRSRTVPARQAQEDPGRRRQRARQLAHHLRLGDGQLEPAQPQALPAVLRRQGRRSTEGQSPREGRRWNADGERDAGGAECGWRRTVNQFGDSTKPLD
jgi:hypothetical protein